MRIASVDTVRLFAILAVVAIHARPFSLPAGEVNNLYYYLDVVINQIARFAVPFFFAISGYFYGIKLSKGACPIVVAKGMLLKLLGLYVGWCLIYFFPYNLNLFIEQGAAGAIKQACEDVVAFLSSPTDILFQGSKVHLWFLPSLMISTIITGLFIRLQLKRTLIIVAASLYLIGLLAKSYSATSLGIEVDFNTRNGPFFGLLLFVTGYWLSSKSPKQAWFTMGLLFFAIGVLLHFSEIYLLMKWHGTSMMQDYVFGTYLMGVGAVLLSLSNHRLLSNPRLAKIGEMTLGIYASHFIFVEVLRPLDEAWSHPVWEVLIVPLIFGLSLAFTKALSLYKHSRRLVI